MAEYIPASQLYTWRSMPASPSRPFDPKALIESHEDLLALVSYATEPLLSAESYPVGLPVLSMGRMGLLMSREKYIAQYGFILLTKECLNALFELLRGKRVLDVGSGVGFLAHCLAEKGVEITALESFDPSTEENEYFRGKPWKLDKTCSFEDELPGEYDVVILSWPCMDKPFAYEVALSMKPGQLLVYQGEWRGCTADGAFFDYIDGPDWSVEEQSTRALNAHHRSFPDIKDRWLVLRKCSSDNPEA